jgi:hypothetical protein
MATSSGRSGAARASTTESKRDPPTCRLRRFLAASGEIEKQTLIGDVLGSGGCTDRNGSRPEEVGSVGGLKDTDDDDRYLVKLAHGGYERGQRLDLRREQLTDMGLRVGSARHGEPNQRSVVFNPEE